MEGTIFLFLFLIFFFLIPTSLPSPNNHQCNFLSLIKFIQLHNDLALNDVILISNDVTESANPILCNLSLNDLSLENGHLFTSRAVSMDSLLKNSLRLNIGKEYSSIVLLSTEFFYDNEKLSLFLNQSSVALSNACWIILYPLDVEKSISAKKLEFLFKDILFRRMEHLRFDSQVYVVASNSTEISLFEAYRICDMAAPVIRHVVTLNHDTNSISFDDEYFIWERRKNLQGCELFSTFIPSSSAFHENRDDEKNSQHTDYHSDAFMYSSSIKIDGISYYGTSADVFSILMAELNFTLKAVIPEKRSYGIYDPKTQSWNGIIGVVAENQAEFALNDLTVTTSRSEVVDFIAPIYFQCKLPCTW